MTGATEYAFFEFTTSLASSYDRWTVVDFVRHYRFGGGRAVDLLEIGHLREIAEQYAYAGGAVGAFRNLADQIADTVRKLGSDALPYPFRNTYDFGTVAFAHGDGTVSGEFIGEAQDSGDMIRISGEASFEFSDVFADPLDVGVEPGGTPYPITGGWSARFLAEVFKERERSDYYKRDER